MALTTNTGIVCRHLEPYSAAGVSVKGLETDMVVKAVRRSGREFAHVFSVEV